MKLAPVSHMSSRLSPENGSPKDLSHLEISFQNTLEPLNVLVEVLYESGIRITAINKMNTIRLERLQSLDRSLMSWTGSEKSK